MGSPQKLKRGSISNINPEFQSLSLNSRQYFPAKMDMRMSLRKMMSYAWPPGSVRRLSQTTGKHYFIIRMNDVYRNMQKPTNPHDHYQKMITSIQTLQQSQRPSQHERAVEELEQGMMDAIFGSNAIEKVGGTKRVTYRICKSVFAGIIVNVEEIDNREDGYEAELLHLTSMGCSTDITTIIRSRYEILQHAKAMKYVIDALVVENKPLTEEIIRETHRILMQHSEHEEIGGKYRKSDEAASHGLRLETDIEYNERVKEVRRLKPNRPPPERLEKPMFFSKFVRGASVPIYMRQLIEAYNKDIKDAEESGEMDPVDIASRYCNLFVCIHPFEDGNGRVCRLIMNAILLKYAGTCIEIGVEPKEREEYLEQAYYANKAFTQQDQRDITFDKQTSHHSLGMMVLQKVSMRLNHMKERLSGN